jgi:hypothetical protein
MCILACEYIICCFISHILTSSIQPLLWESWRWMKCCPFDSFMSVYTVRVSFLIFHVEFVELTIKTLVIAQLSISFFADALITCGTVYCLIKTKSDTTRFGTTTSSEVPFLINFCRAQSMLSRFARIVALSAAVPALLYVPSLRKIIFMNIGANNSLSSKQCPLKRYYCGR